jgi:hypothetical protein
MGFAIGVAGMSHFEHSGVVSHPKTPLAYVYLSARTRAVIQITGGEGPQCSNRI